MAAVGQILPPCSEPACPLPPNADIAMFAGRAAPTGEQARPAGGARRAGKENDRGLSAVVRVPDNCLLVRSCPS
jgi:hypothetical protein